MAKESRRYRLMMMTSAMLLALSAASFVLSVLGIAADWIGFFGLVLMPIEITFLAVGAAGAVNPSLAPPHPLQVLNNCQ